MKLRFTTGELARLHGVSKQTLIFYDKAGVFCPREKDPHNGYRYYTEDQLELLDHILMLKDMNDASTIGPKMAVALVTTLYGSLIANWLCNPTASKLSVNNNNEMMMKEITVEGILSIQAGENPRVIEEKLKSFLSPSAREETAEGSVGGEE